MSEERDAYEMEVHKVMQRLWQREGENLTVNAVDLNTPLVRLLQREREETGAAGLDVEIETELRDDERRKTLRVLLDFLGADGPYPTKMLARLYLLCDAASPDHIWRMNLAEMGRLLGCTRAAMQARRDRIILGMVEESTGRRVTAANGKSASARDTYRKGKLGNNCRRGGKRATQFSIKPN